MVTIEELMENKGELKSLEEFTYLLNQPPYSNFIKKNNGFNYLPIDKVELMLKMIFKSLVKYEVKSVEVMLNSVVCRVRLHYFHPIIKEWMFHDGVAATTIQLDKGAAVGDFNKLKKNALELNVPSVASVAFKNAAQKLGTFLGGDLNRKDSIEFIANEEAVTEKILDIDAARIEYSRYKEDLSQGNARLSVVIKKIKKSYAIIEGEDEEPEPLKKLIANLGKLVPVPVSVQPVQPVQNTEVKK